MKRRIAVRDAALAGIISMLALGSCGTEPDALPRQSREMQTSWAAPARLESAVFSTDGVVLTGAAAPGDRIVLTDVAGVSVAATAGADGAFSLRLPPSDGVTLHHSEIQSRGSQARAGEWLVITPGPSPVAAVLAPGGASAPLNRARLLAAVDYDGSGVLVSGTARPGQTVRVSVDDGPPRTATADPTGRHVARFPAIPPGPRRFRVEAGDDSQDVLLNLSAPSDELSAAVSGVATRVDWPTPGGGFQSSWMLAPTPGED
ncbi:MAG: Ig-like domain-containing protein [Brevundimonas sp.]|uniref:Ig-like domain-containing protein n=1 Tax=Brevundimonas sp. TaxID=1871086 RepID=UPI003918F779